MLSFDSKNIASGIFDKKKKNYIVQKVKTLNYVYFLTFDLEES